MSAPVAASSATAPPIDVSNLFSVKGLVALITGGGSGMPLFPLSSLSLSPLPSCLLPPFAKKPD